MSFATRLISVNEANLTHGHIYVNGVEGFFPRDSIGASSRKAGLGRLLQLDVEGLSAPVLTDIPRDAKTGRSRGIFRERKWVKQFFRAHGIRAGDTIAIEKTGDYRYAVRRTRVQPQFTAAEFFAGIELSTSPTWCE